MVGFRSSCQGSLCGIVAVVSEPWMPFGIFIRGGRRIPVDRFTMLPGNSGQDCFDVPPSGQEAEEPYDAEHVEVVHPDGPVIAWLRMRSSQTSIVPIWNDHREVTVMVY